MAVWCACVIGLLGKGENMANTKLTRRAFIGSAGMASIALAACGGGNGGGSAAAAFDGALTGTYSMHIQGYDWGCGVDKITLALNAPLDAVDVDSFVVSEHKQATDWTAEDFPVIEADFPRTVTAATVNGNNVELELACDPNSGSPFLYTMATGYNTWCDPYEINITLGEGVELASGGTAVTSVAIEPVAASKTTSADEANWSTDSYDAADGTTYPYAFWDPEEESKNLVVWLHGAGEGGTEATDPWVTILANKVVALSGDDFQSTVGGAHVVAPQSPTMWMDQDGKKTYIAEDAKEVTTIYTESLEEFIDSYAEKVGAEKIFVCGCSNGGFMTLWMGLHRPDKYVGIAPICEAIPDGAISDEQIEGIKDLPMYFVWSDDDTTVVPETHEIPTVERLKKAGAANLHVSTTEHVVDTTGMYKDEEGNPYQYNGHWSWIYFDNNECACTDDGMKVFDFIAECFK